MSAKLTDAEAVLQCPRNLKLRALNGTTIVWFLPYRRTEGVIEFPDKFTPISCEAIIISDSSRHSLSPGVMVGVSRKSGTNFEFEGHELSVVPGDAMILVNTKFSPEEAA